MASLYFPCQIAYAVTMQGNIYKTTSKKHSARKWTKNGQSNYKRGRYERAVRAFNNAVSSYPKYFEAWDGLGNALYCLGKYDMAIQAYDKALSIDPHHYSTVVNKGISFYKKGNSLI